MARKYHHGCSLSNAHPPDRSFGTNSPADFRIVSGILRLSTKYLCDSLRAKALSHLSVAWPSDLRGWDTREDQARYWELEMPEQASIGIYPSPIVSPIFIIGRHMCTQDTFTGCDKSSERDRCPFSPPFRFLRPLTSLVRSYI